MIKAFEETKGHLSLRLMAALDAGQAAGGDTRGMQAASMVIVKKGGGVWLNNDTVLRFQVDDSQNPVQGTAPRRRKLERRAREGRCTAGEVIARALLAIVVHLRRARGWCPVSRRLSAAPDVSIGSSRRWRRRPSRSFQAMPLTAAFSTASVGGCSLAADSRGRDAARRCRGPGHRPGRLQSTGSDCLRSRTARDRLAPRREERRAWPAKSRRSSCLAAAGTP